MFVIFLKKLLRMRHCQSVRKPTWCLLQTFAVPDSLFCLKLVLIISKWQRRERERGGGVEREKERGRRRKRERMRQMISLNAECVGWDEMRLTLFNTKQIGQRLHHELLQWITQIRPLWNWIWARQSAGRWRLDWHNWFEIGLCNFLILYPQK